MRKKTTKLHAPVLPSFLDDSEIPGSHVDMNNYLLAALPSGAQQAWEVHALTSSPQGTPGRRAEAPDVKPPFFLSPCSAVLVPCPFGRQGFCPSLQETGLFQYSQASEALCFSPPPVLAALCSGFFSPSPLSLLLFCTWCPEDGSPPAPRSHGVFRGIARTRTLSIRFFQTIIL